MRHVVIREAFVFCAAVALLTFSAVLSWSIRGSKLILETPDPLFSFSSRVTIYLIIALALSVSILILVLDGKYNSLKLHLLAYLALNLLVYQFGTLWSGSPNFLNCLGNLNDRIPIAPGTLVYIWSALFLFLFTGAASLLAVEYLDKQRKSFRIDRPIVEQGSTYGNKGQLC